MAISNHLFSPTSENHINARLYGKDSYSAFSSSIEKLVAWKQLLSTKMELLNETPLG